MNFQELATQLVMSKIAGANNSADVESALDKLTGSNKKFDLGDLVSRFQDSGGDLAERTKSWLGDGSNEAISATQIKDALGAEKVDAFARQLGIDGDEAGHSLARILPELIDKSSHGGKLLGSIGESLGNHKGLLASFASKFLRKSA